MKTICFDLDGTLTDPKVGITKSVQYALKKFGINIPDPDELCCFIGPPLRESFHKYYGFDAEKANEAVEEYRKYFTVTGIYENTLFEGIAEMLESLKNQGKRIILATSKPEAYAVSILQYFDLEKYFDFIGGSELDGKRSGKAEVISYALEKYPVADKAKTVMVGDRSHDIIGAKKTGIASIGVLYGYGDYEELSGAKADIIVGSVAELSRALLI